MNYAKNAVAEIDWENYFANKLISNGTAIYFSDDNLVTVTNLVDGSLGLATDITNNELSDGTEINRLGAAVASLSTQEQVEINSNPYQLLKSSLDIEQEFGLNLTLVGHSISIPFTGNYDINVTNTIGVATNYTGTGVFTLTGITPVFISKIDGTHNNGFELFDFNQSKGATVISHASALICALGGLVQSGYVRANTGVSLVGYLFSGSTTALLQLTGAYSGTVTYVDDTTLAINGSGNYTVDNSHVKAIKKIDVTDTEKTYLYDGTSGDESKLIETQYANHASISNDSTTGFQPIIEKEVLTIGNDAKWDYINVGTGLSAQQNPSSAKNTHFKVMTDVVENATRYIHNNLEVNWQITVEGNKEYNGSDDSVFKVSKPNDRVNFSFYDNKTSVFFKHLQIERPKITAATVSVTNIAFDRCLLDGLMAETYALMTGNRLERGYIVKDSKVRNFKTSADEGYTTYLNSIVIDCSGNYSSYSNIGGSSSHIETYATDTLSILTTNHFKYGASIPKCFDSGVSGSNNMSSDDSALTHGIGAQDAGLEAYFDNNGQLTQAGQDATKNQGYLGSNMVEWAYALTGISSVYSDLDIRNQVLTSTFSDIDIRNKILAALVSVISDLDVRNSIYTSVINNVDIRNSILSSTVSDTDIRNSILTSAFHDVDVRASILSAVWSDIDIRNEILAAAGYVISDLDVRNAISGVTVSDLDVRNQILVSIHQDIDLRNQVLQSITKDVDIRSSILSFAYQDVDVRNQIFAFTYADIDIRNDIDGLSEISHYSFSSTEQTYTFEEQNALYSFTTNNNQYSF